MGEITSIGYADHTRSPWKGCSRKSAGCAGCFAEAWARRWGKPELWLKNGPREILSEAGWRELYRWNRQAMKDGRRHRILCGTLCDVFEPHPGVIEARKRLWDVIESTPWLVYMLFTKRPEEVNGLVSWGDDWPDNVWLIVSVEDQRSANERLDLLAGTKAKVKGLSCEPLIEPVDLSAWICDERPVTGSCSDAPDGAAVGGIRRSGDIWYRDRQWLDWVIIGGESGC